MLKRKITGALIGASVMPAFFAAAWLIDHYPKIVAWTFLTSMFVLLTLLGWKIAEME